MLTWDLDTSTPAAVLRLIGQLDLAGAATVRAALHKARAEQPTAILVDLCDTVVIEDIVFTVFTSFARAAADWPGCPVLLSADDPPLHASMERMGITRVVPVYPDRASGLAAAHAIPAPRSYRGTVAATAPATSAARRMVRAACLSWELPDLVDDAELIVTELVSNVIRHVGGMMEIVLSRRGRFLHMSVRDRSMAVPMRTLPDPETDEGGRGLLLLDAMAAAWGSMEVAEGKVVWATLRIAR